MGLRKHIDTFVVRGTVDVAVWCNRRNNFLVRDFWVCGPVICPRCLSHTAGEWTTRHEKISGNFHKRQMTAKDEKGVAWPALYAIDSFNCNPMSRWLHPANNCVRPRGKVRRLTSQSTGWWLRPLPQKKQTTRGRLWHKMNKLTAMLRVPVMKQTEMLLGHVTHVKFSDKENFKPPPSSCSSAEFFAATRTAIGSVDSCPPVPLITPPPPSPLLFESTTKPVRSSSATWTHMQISWKKKNLPGSSWISWWNFKKIDTKKQTSWGEKALPRACDRWSSCRPTEPHRRPSHRLEGPRIGATHSDVSLTGGRRTTTRYLKLFFPRLLHLRSFSFEKRVETLHKFHEFF